MRVRTVDNAEGDRKFSAAVKKRDGHACRLEVWNGTKYVPCGTSGSPMNPIDAAHVYNRNQCGSAKWDPEVGVAACRNHHDLLDRHSDTVRVPFARENLAYRAIRAASKSAPPRRLLPLKPKAAA